MSTSLRKESDNPELTPDGVAKVFLEELKKILTDEKELNEAVKARHILADKKATLETIADRFNAEGKAIAAIEYHEKERADNERKLYLPDAISDRDAIALQSAYFTAAAKTTEIYLPVLAPKMAFDKTVGDSLKLMVENARFTVATELRDVAANFSDRRSGYEVKPEFNARLDEIQAGLSSLLPAYSNVMRHFQACLNQLKLVELDIMKKVNQAGGSAKNVNEAVEWIQLQNTSNPKLKGLSALNQAVADRGALQKFVNVLTPGEGKPSAEERVKNFYASFREWRSEYKGAHGVGVSIFKKVPSPVYKVWQEVKPTVKALEKEKLKMTKP